MPSVNENTTLQLENRLARDQAHKLARRLKGLRPENVRIAFGQVTNIDNLETSRTVQVLVNRRYYTVFVSGSAEFAVGDYVPVFLNDEAMTSGWIIGGGGVKTSSGDYTATLYDPEFIDDYSATAGEMQTQADPYPGASGLSMPVNLAQELTRLRYQVNQVLGGTYWYEDPLTSLTAVQAHISGTASDEHASGIGDHTHESAGAQGEKLDHGLALTGVSSDQHHPQQHDIDSMVNHTGFSTITGTWIFTGGGLRGDSGDPPNGEIVLQVKTTTGAPTHSATEGTACWNSVDDELYVNNDGSTGWTKIAGASLADHDHTSAGGDGGVLTNDEHDGYSQYTNIAAPATPPSGSDRIFAVERPDGSSSIAWVNDDGVVRMYGGYRTLEVIFDNRGSALISGTQLELTVDFSGEIEAVTMFAIGASGSAEIDVWKASYADYPPTVADSITAAAIPAISAGLKSKDTTLTGWTTTITTGDAIRFNVNSCTSITRCLIALKVRET